MHFRKKVTGFIFITALILHLPVLCSCAQTSTISEESLQGSSDIGIDSKAAKVTYEFSDIPVPVELERVEDKTMIVMTPGFHGGTLALKGKVTISSLVEFFKKSLPAHGWKLVGTFNAKRSFLAFSKGSNAHCLIQICDGPMGFNTEVQIWVSELFVQR